MAKITSSIRIHDKLQFELKLTYPLDKEKLTSEYLIETYLFIPGNLDITPLNYGKREFYSDIQKYIRLKTPAFTLHNLYKELDNPFEQLQQTILQLAANASSITVVTEYRHRLKMFCSIFKSALRDDCLAILKQQDPTALQENTISLLQVIKKLVTKFRNLKTKLKSQQDEKIIALFDLADEYISLLIEKEAYAWWGFLKKRDELTLANKVVSLAQSELSYRVDKEFPSTPNEKDNSRIVFRGRILKKVMGNILFLQTRLKKEGKILKQLSMGIAAAMAMALATAFIFLSRTTFEDFSISLFIVLVGIYVFKDRLKELCSALLYKTFHKYLYDYKTFLQTSAGERVGCYRESFEFIAEKALPSEIKKIRNKDYIVELENGYTPESIIFFKKELSLSIAKCHKLNKEFNIDGINDIIRFNVRHILNKMDDPHKFIAYPVDSETFNKVKAEVLYHLNLIIKYSSSSKTKFQKIRIILSRDGIKSIEKAKNFKA